MPTKYKRSTSGYRDSRPPGKKNPPTGTDADLNLVSLLPLFTDEDKAREFVESKRWPTGPVCPHCGTDEVYKLTAKPGSKSPVRPGVYKCKACRKQFTVRVGSIFEDSKLPLRKWLMAIHSMCASKKGVSSHQIARQLDITQKTAWFLCHRIRLAMKAGPMQILLGGPVEVDETYVGGKPREKGTSKRGRGTSKKAVVALVERDGRVRSMPVDFVDSKTLHETVKTHVDQKAAIHTDEHKGYLGIGRFYAGGHYTVCHSRKEYVRFTDEGDPVHVNTAESYFALIKRSHYGIHHHFSKHHLHRYCDERSFMWDKRKVSDGERMVAAIEGAEGKRLMYREPVSG